MVFCEISTQKYRPVKLSSKSDRFGISLKLIKKVCISYSLLIVCQRNNADFDKITIIITTKII